MGLSSEARWRWAIVVLPLVVAVVMLGRVWTHHFRFLGSDQLVTERMVDNAWGFLRAPGSAPWSWPAQSPGCVGDHVLGLAALMAPWSALGLTYAPAMWITTAVTLALNGTLLGVLLRRWGVSPLGSGTAAVLAVGLPVLVQRLVHTINLEMCWILAWTIALDFFLEKPGRLRGFSLCLAGLGLGIMPATVMQWSALCLPILALIAVIRQRPGGKSIAGVAALQVPALLLWCWIYHPYFTHSYPPNVIVPTPWQDALRPLGVVAWPPGPPQADSLATPGPVPVLGVIGLVVAIAVGRLRMVAAGLLAAVVVDLFFAMSFGAWTPVDALRGLPLFSGMRSPARFAIPAGILAVSGVALAIDVLVAKQRPRFALTLAGLAFSGQMLVDGGPVVPVRLVNYPPLDLRAVSDAAPPGPVLAMPTGVLDDAIGIATGRVTVGTTNGRPTDWQQHLDSDPAAAEPTLIALQRMGLAGVITDDERAGPVPAMLQRMGAKPLATGFPGLTWWALPPKPAGTWTCTVDMARTASGWRLTIISEPGAPAIEGQVRAQGMTWLMVPFLPGTRAISVDLPGAERPQLSFIPDVPVRWENQ